MNTNCLAGTMCPKCFSDGPFQIQATSVFTVTDDGTGIEHGDVEWQDDSYCRCSACNHQGKLKDFQDPRVFIRLALREFDRKTPDLRRIREILQSTIG